LIWSRINAAPDEVPVDGFREDVVERGPVARVRIEHVVYPGPPCRQVDPGEREHPEMVLGGLVASNDVGVDVLRVHLMRVAVLIGSEPVADLLVDLDDQIVQIHPVRRGRRAVVGRGVHGRKARRRLGRGLGFQACSQLVDECACLGGSDVVQPPFGGRTSLPAPVLGPERRVSCALAASAVYPTASRMPSA
jgi:hypothetical protein